MLYEDLFSYKQYRIFSYIFTNSIFLIFFISLLTYLYLLVVKQCRQAYPVKSRLSLSSVSFSLPPCSLAESTANTKEEKIM